MEKQSQRRFYYHHPSHKATARQAEGTERRKFLQLIVFMFLFYYIFCADSRFSPAVYRDVETESGAVALCGGWWLMNFVLLKKPRKIRALFLFIMQNLFE